MKICSTLMKVLVMSSYLIIMKWVDINNINLENNFDKDDPDTIFLIRLLAWHTKFEKRKALKKKLNEELMSVALHPNGWWERCVSEDEKKEMHLFYINNQKFKQSPRKSLIC